MPAAESVRCKACRAWRESSKTTRPCSERNPSFQVYLDLHRKEVEGGWVGGMG